MSEQDKRRWTLGAIAVLVTWSLTVVGAVWAASADRAVMWGQIRSQAAQTADHELRLRSVEKQAEQIAADVRWIRQTLEKQKP